MKKITLIMTAILCGCLFTTSCDDNKTYTEDEPYPRDKSLAGSVSLSQYIIKAEGEYQETILKDLESNRSRLEIDKISDTEIALYCQTLWEKTIVSISLPKIPLAGVAYNATFDYTSDAASVTYNDKKYTPINTTIKGWVKEIGTKVYWSSNKSADDKPAPIFYECNINISCTIDGKPLNLKIIEIDPYGKP